MIVERLTLRHFRNYQDETFEMSPRINVITGANAQGKTNMLEGLFLLSRGYSHRTNRTADLMMQGDPRFDGFAVEAETVSKGSHHRLALQVKDGHKAWVVDGHSGRRQKDTHRLLHTILFEPDDLRIVKAGPARRRQFIDEEISGYLPGYLPVLKNYKKALSQRNALLKEIRRSPSMAVLLEGWDAQLVENGAKVVIYRLAYLKRLNETARALHTSLSDNKEKLSLSYSSNLIAEAAADQDAIQKRFAEKLKAGRDEDIAKGSTVCGPHVDDLLIDINGMEARKFASQGQQRTAAIALKLSQIDIYKKMTGERPVVLLDDILSELDDRRQEKILDILGQTQALITCTDSRFADRYPDEMKRIVTVQNGHQISR